MSLYTTLKLPKPNSIPWPQSQKLDLSDLNDWEDLGEEFFIYGLNRGILPLEPAQSCLTQLFEVGMQLLTKCKNLELMMQQHPQCHIVVAYHGLGEFARQRLTMIRLGQAAAMIPKYTKAADSTDPLEHCQLPPLDGSHFLLVVRLILGPSTEHSMDCLLYKPFDPLLVPAPHGISFSSSNSQHSRPEQSSELGGRETAPCSLCSKPVLTVVRCPSCKIEEYCSRSCLRSAIKEHRPLCTKLQAIRIQKQKEEDQKQEEEKQKLEEVKRRRKEIEDELKRVKQGLRNVA